MDNFPTPSFRRYPYALQPLAVSFSHPTALTITPTLPALVALAAFHNHHSGWINTPPPTGSVTMRTLYSSAVLVSALLPITDSLAAFAVYL